MTPKARVMMKITIEFAANSVGAAKARVAGIRRAIEDHIERGVQGAGPTGAIAGSVKVEISEQGVTEIPAQSG